MAKLFKEKYFKQEYVEYIKQKKLFHYFQDDFNIEYRKNIINKNIVKFKYASVNKFKF